MFFNKNLINFIEYRSRRGCLGFRTSCFLLMTLFDLILPRLGNLWTYHVFSWTDWHAVLFWQRHSSHKVCCHFPIWLPTHILTSQMLSWKVRRREHARLLLAGPTPHFFLMAPALVVSRNSTSLLLMRCGCLRIILVQIMRISRHIHSSPIIIKGLLHLLLHSILVEMRIHVQLSILKIPFELLLNLLVHKVQEWLFIQVIIEVGGQINIILAPRLTRSNFFQLVLIVEVHDVLGVNLNLHWVLAPVVTIVRHSTNTTRPTLPRMIEERAWSGFGTRTSQRLSIVEQRFKVKKHKRLVLVRRSFPVLVCQITQHQPVG